MEGYIPASMFIAGLAIIGILAIVAIALYARTNGTLNSIAELVTESPRICYVCRRFELGHDALSEAEDEDPYHVFVPAHLVYIPEPDLR